MTVAAIAFGVAWAIGRASSSVSVLQAFGVAVYSYVFWAYSFLGLVVTEWLLYLAWSSLSYVPPPIAAWAVPSSALRETAVVSIIHCLSTGLTGALLWRALTRIERLMKVRGGVLFGASVGIIIGIAAVLPRDVIMTSPTLNVAVAVATAPVDIVFDWLNLTVPIAAHRLEMAVDRVPRLIGGYVLLLSVVYAVVGGIVVRLISVRSQDVAKR